MLFCHSGAVANKAEKGIEAKEVATTGCVAACLFKEFQTSVSFEGPLKTVPEANFDLLNMDRHMLDPNKNALLRGEFEVIKELVAELKDKGEFWDMDWCSPQPISQPTPTKCPCPKKKCHKERNRRVRKTEKYPNI